MAAPAFAESLSVAISQSSDDAEEFLGGSGALDGQGLTGFVLLNSSDLELGDEGSGGFTDPQAIGLRFTNISIPTNAFITSAWIQFHSDDGTETAQVGNNEFRIFGELSLNPGTFLGSSSTGGEGPYNQPANDRNITNRPRTTQSVVWDDIPFDRPEGVAQVGQQTPDLSGIIQEIIGQAGWASGNAVAFQIYHSASLDASLNPILGVNTSPFAIDEHEMESYDGIPSRAAVLHIEYSTSSITGDLNGDGFVGAADLDILLANWGDNVTVGSLINGDAVADGVVDDADLQVVRDNWGSGNPPGSPIPEPGSFALLLAAGGMIARRRRK
ncbi:MAG: PEP-CTERM sorting domain-containing protein [Planctomycetota bacterium]